MIHARSRGIIIGTVLVLALTACTAEESVSPTVSVLDDLITTSTDSTTTTTLPLVTTLPGPSSTSAAEKPTTTLITTTTTTVATTTTSTAATSGCPIVAIPADAADIVITAGDFDGDDKADRFISYRLGTGDAPEWWLRMEIFDGGTADLAVPSSVVAASQVRTLGGVDVNGDGRDEAWAVVGGGAATAVLGLYSLDGCDLEAVVLGTDQATFAVGATVGNASGVFCDDTDGNGALDVVVSLEMSSSDGTTYSGTRTGYAFSAGALSPVSSSVITLTTGDTGFTDLGAFRCGSLTYP